MKYLGDDDLFVRVIGPVHGALFTGYILLLWLGLRKDRWKMDVAIKGALLAVLPGGPIYFDKKIMPRGGAQVRRSVRNQGRFMPVCIPLGNDPIRRNTGLAFLKICQGPWLTMLSILTMFTTFSDSIVTPSFSCLGPLFVFFNLAISFHGKTMYILSRTEGPIHLYDASRCRWIGNVEFPHVVLILICQVDDPGTVGCPAIITELPAGYEGPTHLDVIRSVWLGCIKFNRVKRILVGNISDPGTVGCPTEILRHPRWLRGSRSP